MTEPPSAPSSRKLVKIGALAIPQRALLGALVVLLYVAGAAFVVGYSNRDTTAPAAPANTQTALITRCWDGTKVERGNPCSTDFDGKSLFWAFGLDPTTVPCERAKEYDWSDIGFTCAYKGVDLRMAIWRTPEWRDQRLTEYGAADSVGRGLLLHGVGTAGDDGRVLLRYDSDVVLLYASVEADEAKTLDQLAARAKSRTALLYGAKVEAK